MDADNWEDLNVDAQADLIAWHHIRDNEQMKEKIEFAKAGSPMR